MRPVDRQRLAREAGVLCAGRGGRLLFLTLFGSRLYGTSVEGRSDLDVYGIYMPTPATLALGGGTGTIRVSTGDGATRNGRGDTDLVLIPVLEWLTGLLPRGAVVATDLLFAAGRPDCVLLRDQRLDAIFAEPLRYLGLADGSACREYCLRQARQYGIRGSRLGTLRAALAAAGELCPRDRERTRLSAILAGLLGRCADGVLCRRLPEEEGADLMLCGKGYQGSMSVARFMEQVESALSRTRHPGIDPATGRGVDWKALSHALRAIRQDEEILRTGTLRYPLACAGELLAVRGGRLPWREVETRIVDGLDALDRLRARSPHARAVPEAVSRAAVLACYGIGDGAEGFPAS